jgi:hypothetical protein
MKRVPWVLWKGSLAMGGGAAAAMIIVGSPFSSDHPNFLRRTSVGVGTRELALGPTLALVGASSLANFSLPIALSPNDTKLW